MSSTEKEKLENPAAYFKHPLDVVRDSELTREQKTSILDRLELDARLMARAADENMSGGEPDRLIDVMDAKNQLDVAALPKRI